MCSVETHPPQVFQWRRVEMTTKRVLHRTRRHVHRRGDVVQAYIGIRVLMNESDCVSQYRRQIPHVIETSHCSRTPLNRMVGFASFVYPPEKNRNDNLVNGSPDRIDSMTERMEVQRTIPASAADIFAVLCDPHGHVAIDASGMLQDAEGERAKAVGDSFVVHMDRESLNDYPLGKYDVTVEIREFEKDRLIAWTILGRIRPQIGHVYGYRLEPSAEGEGTLVTSFYDWSDIDPEWRKADIFPVVPESALRATLGILDRTVRRGYPHG